MSVLNTKYAKSPVVIGLTGGMGSGKSTVAQFLRERNALVLDADALVKDWTSSHGLAIPSIQSLFGAFMLKQGALDRDKMRRLITVSEEAKQALEAVLHPEVFTYMLWVISQYRSEFQPMLDKWIKRSRGIAQSAFDMHDFPQQTKLIVLDIPLLMESALREMNRDELTPSLGDYRLLVDYVVLVDCDRQTQCLRAMARTGLSSDQVDGMLDLQLSRSVRYDLADMVLHNGKDTSLTSLESQIDELLEWIV